MKNLFIIILLGVIFVGCSSKETMVQKIEYQHNQHKADDAFKELDRELKK